MGSGQDVQRGNDELKKPRSEVREEEEEEGGGITSKAKYESRHVRYRICEAKQNGGYENTQSDGEAES